MTLTTKEDQNAMTKIGWICDIHMMAGEDEFNCCACLPCVILNNKSYFYNDKPKLYAGAMNNVSTLEEAFEAQTNLYES